MSEAYSQLLPTMPFGYTERHVSLVVLVYCDILLFSIFSNQSLLLILLFMLFCTGAYMYNFFVFNCRSPLVGLHPPSLALILAHSHGLFMLFCTGAYMYNFFVFNCRSPLVGLHPPSLALILAHSHGPPLASWPSSPLIGPTA